MNNINLAVYYFKIHLSILNSCWVEVNCTLRTFRLLWQEAGKFWTCIATQCKFTSFSTNVSFFRIFLHLWHFWWQSKKRKGYVISQLSILEKDFFTVTKGTIPLWNQVLFPTLPNKNKLPVLGDIHFNFHFREPLSNFSSTIEPTSPRVLRRFSSVFALRPIPNLPQRSLDCPWYKDPTFVSAMSRILAIFSPVSLSLLFLFQSHHIAIRDTAWSLNKIQLNTMTHLRDCKHFVRYVGLH